MLIPQTDIYCGVFNSSIMRKNESISLDRTVTCYELECFHEDSGVSYVDGVRYPVRRGMLLCAKPGQTRHSEFPVKCSFIRIFRSEALDPELVRILDTLPDCMYVGKEARIDDLLSLFSKLGAAFVSRTGSALSRVSVNGLFYEILYRIMKESDGESVTDALKKQNKIALEAYEYINEHYCSDCSLKKLADVVKVSPNHLHSVFKQCIGVAPYRYVLEKRIEKAQKLILIGEKEMIEIALETGFCSQSHFNKIYKSITGETPTEYRRKMLERY